MRLGRIRRAAAAALMLASLGPAALAGGTARDRQDADGLHRVGHIVVIYLENRSFDSLFGLYPGATGIADALAEAPKQVDRAGQPYASLPQPIDTTARPPRPDPRFPADLPNRPFAMERYVSLGAKTGDMVHRYYQNIAQIDGGRNDMFVAWSDAGGLPMGYYDGAQTALWHWARRYTLADHFFMGAFGGSFLNHLMMVCACVPRYPDAPAALRARLDSTGRLVKDGAVTPDGFAINTIQPAFMPHSPRITDPSRLLPPQDQPTIGERLSAKGISWAWYADGFAEAEAGHAPPLFQYHHQPFVYFRAYAPGTRARAGHLRDGGRLLADIDAGTLPRVTFYKPGGEDDEHPGYASIAEGDRHTAELLRHLEHGPQWHDMMVVVTYDENGGAYDHVAPPKGDRWGPGSRVPAVVISPFARRGYVDHTPYTTLSILKLIERRFGLAPLTKRDAEADDLGKALVFQ